MQHREEGVVSVLLQIVLLHLTQSHCRLQRFVLFLHLALDQAGALPSRLVEFQLRRASKQLLLVLRHFP